MPEHLEHHVTLATERPDIIVAVKVGNPVLRDLHDGGRSPPRVTAIAEGADDRTKLLPMAGRWPRVFPGL